MHVLLIHQVFNSPDQAGGTRHYELGHHLVQRGHNFTVVASDVTYLSGERSVVGCRLLTEQDADGVRVIRAYTYPSLHRSFFWRVVSFVSFMFTSMLAGLWAGPVDIVMGTSPPIFQAVSAWLVARLRRRPFLLEIRDLWPEFAIGLGVLTNPALIALSRRLERFLYAQASHILVNSPAYRDYLAEMGVRPQKITLVANGVDPTMFDPSAKGEQLRAELGLQEKFIITYAGALGLANDIETIMRAADRLRAHEHIHFLLVGGGKEQERLEKVASQLQLPNLTFVASRPKSEMSQVLAASNACVATLQDIPMFRTTYPNKVFDYMAAGRPTILAIDGVIREVVEGSGGGIFVPPGDDSALAAAALTLSKDEATASAMGRAARDHVVRFFSRKKQAEEFRRLVERLDAKYKSTTRRKVKSTVYARLGKRMFDICVAVLLLLVLSPVLALTALVVRMRLGSPVLFRQVRPGLNGKPFTLVKFRTMIDKRDNEGNSLPDDKRLTILGKFLRSTSLDELPELLNVLRGDMSLVGPRPLLMQYLGRYTPAQMHRHAVRPGITGWAQVNGRNTTSWEERFQLDVWYVEHQSFKLDLLILRQTIHQVILGKDINQPGHATMSEFMGNAQTSHGPIVSEPVAP